MVFAIGLHTGISPDKGGIALFVLERVCDITDSGVGLLVFDCGLFLTMMGIVSIAIGVIVAYVQTNKARNLTVGVVVYVVAWIVGFLIIHSNMV